MILIMHVSHRFYFGFTQTYSYNMQIFYNTIIIQFATLSLQQVKLLPISLQRIHKTFCLYFLKETKTFSCLLLKRHIFGHAFCFSFILKIHVKMISIRLIQQPLVMQNGMPSQLNQKSNSFSGNSNCVTTMIQIRKYTFKAENSNQPFHNFYTRAKTINCCCKIIHLLYMRFGIFSYK